MTPRERWGKLVSMVKFYVIRRTVYGEQCDHIEKWAKREEHAARMEVRRIEKRHEKTQEVDGWCE